MDSTETMMKFGFMSMAMTYFTSMNMVGAMKNISTKDTCSLDGREMNSNLEQIVHLEKRLKQHDSNVLKWDIDNVIEWLSVIHLVQYENIFRDASIDGPFLCQLTDNDLSDALGIHHVLHRKKILFGINQLKEDVRDEEPSRVFQLPTQSNTAATSKSSQSVSMIINEQNKYIVDDSNETVLSNDQIIATKMVSTCDKRNLSS
jgi:hypothetical protein